MTRLGLILSLALAALGAWSAPAVAAGGVTFDSPSGKEYALPLPSARGVGGSGGGGGVSAGAAQSSPQGAVAFGAGIVPTAGHHHRAAAQGLASPAPVAAANPGCCAPASHSERLRARALEARPGKGWLGSGLALLAAVAVAAAAGGGWAIARRPSHAPS